MAKAKKSRPKTVLGGKVVKRNGQCFRVVWRRVKAKKNGGCPKGAVKRRVSSRSRSWQSARSVCAVKRLIRVKSR